MRQRHLFIYIAFILLTILTASCGTSRKATIASRTTPHEREEHRRFVSHLPKERRMIIEEAETWIGTPYLYAGEEKGCGTDCSGMVMQVYMAALGCPIPRNSAKQAEFCRKLKANEVEAGDLVFFATGKDPEKVSHVGIVVENGGFIHSSSSKGVIVSKLSNPWYAKRLLMYGRIPALDDIRAER